MRVSKNIQRYIDDQKSLEDRLFAFVLIVGVVIVWVSMVVTFIERLTPSANIGSIASAIMLLAVIFVAYGLKKMEIARFMLCYILNCFVIPLAFFSCGGIDSGMPLYMIAGIFLVVPVLKGLKRVVCITISFIVDISCIIISYFLMPAAGTDDSSGTLFLAHLSPEARLVDMISSLILIGLYIIITTTLIMDAFQKERESTEELLVKLDELSNKDELTGLYNRREMMEFLEEVPIKYNERFYLCMIDIDHFKSVNDTYGHYFGNVVLKQLAAIMMDGVNEENDEIAVRYGGEEFLLILKADGPEEARRRMDNMRIKFLSIKWDKAPDLIASFSGGLVKCARFGSTSEVIHYADQLLYAAKEKGRNRIEM